MAYEVFGSLKTPHAAGNSADVGVSKRAYMPTIEQSVSSRDVGWVLGFLPGFFLGFEFPGTS
jgi:hypothetical protein